MRVARPWKLSDLLEIVGRQRDGESLAALAAEAGRTRQAIKQQARRQGYALRSERPRRSAPSTPKPPTPEHPPYALTPAEGWLWPKLRRHRLPYHDPKAALRDLERKLHPRREPR